AARPACRAHRRCRDDRRDAAGRGRRRTGVRSTCRAGVRGGVRGMKTPSTPWCVRGALLVLLSFANLNLIWSPDVLPNTLFAWTLVQSGNVDYDEFASESGAPERPDRIDRNAYFFRGCSDVPSNVQIFVPSTSPRSAGGPPPPLPG